LMQLIPTSSDLKRVSLTYSFQIGSSWHYELEWRTIYRPHTRTVPSSLQFLWRPKLRVVSL
jgi:hypothetical protein